jgi:hypothetical protein
VSPGIPPQVTAAFRSALAGLPPASTAGELIPDTGIFHIPLAPDAALEGDLRITALYLQSFNRATTFLVLADSPVLPFRARLLTGPFLEALLAAPAKLPGTTDTAPQTSLQTAAQGEPQGSLIRALLEGFALYGIALTDPLPRLSVEEGEDVLEEAQRFSRGWIQRVNKKTF